ncbi:MAG: hypothetical protein ACRDZ3_22145 [Acidimicrobiia bacterium]
MRKRTMQSRWESLSAAARAHVGSTIDTGIPVTGGVSRKRFTLPLFPARKASETSP